MSRNSITNRCLIGHNTLRQNLGQQLLKLVSIMAPSRFYSGRQSLMQMSSIQSTDTSAWLNTFLYEQHILFLLSVLKYGVLYCTITQMYPSSGENMTNKQHVTEALPKKPIRLSSFLQTGYNYNLITPIRLLTCAECCGANTVWTPAVTAFGR